MKGGRSISSLIVDDRAKCQ